MPTIFKLANSCDEAADFVARALSTMPVFDSLECRRVRTELAASVKYLVDMAETLRKELDETQVKYASSGELVMK